MGERATIIISQLCCPGRLKWQLRYALTTVAIRHSAKVVSSLTSAAPLPTGSMLFLNCGHHCDPIYMRLIPVWFRKTVIKSICSIKKYLFWSLIYKSKTMEKHGSHFLCNSPCLLLIAFLALYTNSDTATPDINRNTCVVIASFVALFWVQFSDYSYSSSSVLELQYAWPIYDDQNLFPFKFRLNMSRGTHVCTKALK